MVRFASRFNFKIDEETFNCAKKFTDRLSIISRERITDEFTKMVTFGSASIIKSLSLMWDLELFKFIIPTLENVPTYDRYIIIQNLLKTVSYTGSHSISVILARLMYEVRKMLPEIPDNYFPETVKIFLRDHLKYSNDVINEVNLLLKENKILEKHFNKLELDDIDFYQNLLPTIRKVMNECGNTDTFIRCISIGDLKIASYFFDYNEYTDDYNSIFDELNDSESKFYNYKLPITGEDVMEIFNIEPGRKIKEILDKTLRFVYVNPQKSDRESCLDFVKYLKQIKDKWNEY